MSFYDATRLPIVVIVSPRTVCTVPRSASRLKVFEVIRHARHMLVCIFDVPFLLSLLLQLREGVVGAGGREWRSEAACLASHD